MGKIKKGERVYRVSSYFIQDGKPNQVSYCEIASMGKIQAVVHHVSEDGSVREWGDKVYSRNKDGDFMFFRTEAEAWAHRVVK